MEQQHRQPAIVERVMGKDNLHQGRLTHIEAVMPGIEALVQLFINRAVYRIEAQLGDVHFSLAQHHLHRFVETFPQYSGTQDVVTIDNRLQGVAEIVQSCAVAQTEQGFQGVWIALLGTDVVVKNTCLQRRQRVNVLHVSSTAGHMLHHAVDLRLSQADQRQQVRGDVFAAFRNQIGWHHDFRATADRCRQCRQRRLAEQYAHIGTQADLTHALDQFHCQQRVAAQFEEVVMATDLFDREYISPDRCQLDLNLALWCFIATTDQRLRIRHWQGLAVELAVGGQRQRIELHVGCRHHVVRQCALQMAAQVFDIEHGFRLLRRDIRHQTLVTRNILAAQHYGFTNIGVFGQACFDFTQLNA
ncbi:Uncharacterized protein AC517_3793 [Pseudomonas syringae pv. syringae]|nr:Uncharacterized protein AC517_3793 [Pseudomonas syringae pv. syringae]